MKKKNQKFQIWRLVYSVFSGLVVITGIVLSNTLEVFNGKIGIKIGFGIASIVIFLFFALIFLFEYKIREKHEFYKPKTITTIMYMIFMILSAVVALYY